MRWLVYALIATFFWGVWGFLPKLVSKKISPESFLIYECIGTILVAIFLLVKIRGKIDYDMFASTCAIGAGMSAFVGTLFFIKAIEIGDCVPVIVITALYPAVILAFCYFLLGEKFTMRQGLAVCFGLCAIFLLSSESESHEAGDDKIGEVVTTTSDSNEAVSNEDI